MLGTLFELHKYKEASSKSGFSDKCFEKYVIQSVDCCHKCKTSLTSTKATSSRKLLIEQGLESIGEIGSVIWDCVREVAKKYYGHCNCN